MFSPDVWGMEIRDVGYLHARSGAAQALLLLGDRERACALAESRAGRRARVRRTASARDRAAGRRAGAGRGRAASRCWRSPSESLRDSPGTCSSGRSRWQSWARRCAGWAAVAARPLLVPRLSTWRPAAGPGRWPSRARTELTAAGGRPRRQRHHGVAALTPSELRVARLAADGQTNRQIAHSLYVTPKTVETHLAHAYAKLGIAAPRRAPRCAPPRSSRRGKPQGAHPDATRGWLGTQFGHTAREGDPK